MDIIKILIDKLSHYNFLTNILPGTVLCIILKYVVGYNLITDEPYLSGVIFYFVGIVNNRVGSLVIEPILKKIRFVRFKEYSAFSQSAEKKERLLRLNADNNMYRSFASVFMISLLALLYKELLSPYIWIDKIEVLILLFMLFLLFICAFRKQTEYVKKHIEDT